MRCIGNLSWSEEWAWVPAGILSFYSAHVMKTRAGIRPQFLLPLAAALPAGEAEKMNRWFIPPALVSHCDPSVGERRIKLMCLLLCILICALIRYDGCINERLGSGNAGAICQNRWKTIVGRKWCHSVKWFQTTQWCQNRPIEAVFNSAEVSAWCLHQVFSTLQI